MSVQTSAYASDALPGETADAVVIGGGAARLNGALVLPTDLTAQVGALASAQSGTSTA
ncbi:hypothetical protein AB0I98_31775 [Streptomyces sp. NPDC050211]|uniref:hypothetical protein n=1 Tax=Streptomyces sp. NPDC050211 TaxID=3154932 RepID=UPI003424AA50